MRTNNIDIQIKRKKLLTKTFMMISYWKKIVPLYHILCKDWSASHGDNAAVQSQKVVSAYFTSKQILPFGFAEQNGALLTYH